MTSAIEEGAKGVLLFFLTSELLVCSEEVGRVEACGGLACSTIPATAPSHTSYFQ